MNLVSLHRSEFDTPYFARLQLLLSENSTASDAKVLEAAFICMSIFVRK